MKYGKAKTFTKIADGKPSKNSAGVDFPLVSLYIYVRASAVGLINLLVDVVG